MRARTQAPQLEVHLPRVLTRTRQQVRKAAVLPPTLECPHHGAAVVLQRGGPLVFTQSQIHLLIGVVVPPLSLILTITKSANLFMMIFQEMTKFNL